MSQFKQSAAWAIVLPKWYKKFLWELEEPDFFREEGGSWSSLLPFLNGRMGDGSIVALVKNPRGAEEPGLELSISKTLANFFDIRKINKSSHLQVLVPAWPKGLLGAKLGEAWTAPKARGLNRDQFCCGSCPILRQEKTSFLSGVYIEGTCKSMTVSFGDGKNLSHCETVEISKKYKKVSNFNYLNLRARLVFRL